MVQLEEYKTKEIKSKETTPTGGMKSALRSMRERCILWGGMAFLFVVACILDYIKGEPLPGWRMITWQILAFALIMFCCWKMWKLMKNVRRQEIFTSQNASIIESVGTKIDVFGLITIIMGRWLDDTYLPLAIIMILSGVFIQFVSHLIHAGIAMREEQDLTV